MEISQDTHQTLRVTQPMQITNMPTVTATVRNRSSSEEAEIPNFWKMKVDPTISRRRVAGGIILNHDLTQIILVKSQCSGKWGIPKGGVEDDESDIEGALREIYEECGLIIESPLMDAMAPCITYRGVRIFLFCFPGPQDTLKLCPIDTLEISECGWFPLDSLQQKLSDIDDNLHQKLDEDKVDDFQNGLSSISTSPVLATPVDLQNKLPVISTKFFEEMETFSSPDLISQWICHNNTNNLSGFVIQPDSNIDRNNIEDPKRISITTLLRDLLRERLDAIKRKIITNMDNYQISQGKIIINAVLANILKEFKKTSTRHVNIIHDIQERFPTVFYLPELIRVLETSA